MERAISSRFSSLDGTKFYCVVRDENNSCKGCAFAAWLDNEHNDCNKPENAGECLVEFRSDKNNVIFVLDED